MPQRDRTPWQVKCHAQQSHQCASTDSCLWDLSETLLAQVDKLMVVKYKKRVISLDKILFLSTFLGGTYLSLFSQVAQARNIGIGDHRHRCITICMEKKPVVSVTNENGRISIKNSLPYIKCVLRISWVFHGPVYGRSMGCTVLYKGVTQQCQCSPMLIFRAWYTCVIFSFFCGMN